MGGYDNHAAIPMRYSFPRLVITILLTLLALQSETPSAQAAKLKMSTDPKKTCSSIRISGEIIAGDYNRFADALKKTAAVAPVRRVYLNNIGGQLLAALAMTDLIR